MLFILNQGNQLLVKMRVEELIEVCRLCLKKENLVCIFEQSENTDSLKDVIFITTGVEVRINLNT